MMRRPLYLYAALLCTLVASSCAPAPRLAVPPEILSADWSRPTAAPDGPDGSLGEALGSPELAALIDRAYKASPELLASGERVEQALALARAARDAGRPVVGASVGTVAARHGIFDFGSSFVTLDAAFTPDLWGERRAGRRAARARAEAAAGDTAALRARTAAEIARLFIGRAALARRLALLDRSIAQSAQVERILTMRVREGASSRVELGLQAVRSRRLEAERLRLAGASEQSRVALALLVGEEAPRFAAAPADLAGFSVPRPRVPTPAELASTRPDLRAAEARLRAAGGDVAIARAAFFPQMDLSAGRAAGAALTGGLSLGASVIAPIFNRGALRGELDAASSRQREAALNYRQAVLTALADVEGALASADTARQRQAVLADLGKEASATADLARRRYLEGMAGLQELLDAQDLLVAADDAEALAREEQLDAAVALWRAIGAPAES